MRRLLPVLGVVAAVAAAAAPSGAQAPATPKGTSSEGARFTLVGQVVTIVLPTRLRPGRVLSAECGMTTVQRSAVGEGRAIGRGLRTVRVRLHGEVGSVEWCEYDVRGRRRSAAAMHPGARAFEPLAPGPGVREAIAEDRNGGGRFLQRGSLVTVEMNEPFARSVVAGVGCGSRRGAAHGFRRVAVAAGQRVIAVDTEVDLATATWCLLEAPGGADYLEATLP